MTRSELLRFLRAQPWAVQASVDAQGQPQAAAIGVAVTVTDALELVFDTLTDSRKAANLRGHPRIALVMGWDDGQTAQIEGLVDEPTGDDLRRLKAVYLQRFPDGHERAARADVAYFRVSPVWIRYSDFRSTPPTVVVFDAVTSVAAEAGPRMPGVPAANLRNRSPDATRGVAMSKPFVNLDEVPFDDVEDNGFYTSRRALFSAAIGARKLGYNLTELPPGKAQCPFHAHREEEEMFLILDGEGELRFGEQRFKLRRHDVVACPTGGAEVAHQIINTGNVPLRYLSLSTVSTTEVCEYPDSQKIGIFASTTPTSSLRKMLRAEGVVDYYDRESLEPPAGGA